jgi:acetylornithine/succinyldiaminopimelate/putrescine aminotransferase
LRDELIDLAFHRGLLLLPCGPSTIRFCPPLCLTARQVNIGLELLAASMDAASAQLQRMKANARGSITELQEVATESV